MTGCIPLHRLLVLLLLAGLVRHRAAGLAGALAGSLALAAAAFCAGFFKIRVVDSFNVFHYIILPKNNYFNIKSITYYFGTCNSFLTY